MSKPKKQLWTAHDHDVFETARQERIASGEEHACRLCGCSESRACPGGCEWTDESKVLCTSCLEQVAPGLASAKRVGEMWRDL